MRHIKVTIGIPTYEAGESLLITLRSIFNQSALKKIKKVIVAVDGKRINKSFFEEFNKDVLEVKHFSVRKGQAGRINDLMRACDTDFLILTNDDIVLEEHAVERMIIEFRRSNADLIAGIVKSLNPVTPFEKALELGVKLNNKIANKWNRGDNYLSANGRFMGISKKLYSSIRLPEQLWNNDAYFYLFAKTNGLTFGRAVRAVAYFKSPHTLEEHLKQSKKFQNSRQENQLYFKSDIGAFYKIPLKLQLQMFPIALIENPYSFAIYLLTFIFTRIHNIMNKKVLHKAGFWPTDVSTKMLRFFM